MDALGAVRRKALQVQSTHDDALPETDEEKKAALEKKAEDGKAVLDFLKETLGDRIKEARVSKILKSGPVCMAADGPMHPGDGEVLQEGRMPDMPRSMKAERVLEVNPDSAALRRPAEGHGERPGEGQASMPSCSIAQALLIADLPLEDPSAYTDLVCSLMD